MSKVFVLGANGYVGSALVKKMPSLIEYDVISVGRRGSGIYLDLLSSHQAILDAIRFNDFVIFLAAISSPDTCDKKNKLANEVNVTATCELIKKQSILVYKGACNLVVKTR